MSKLKTFKMEHDEVTQLKSLSRRLGLSEADTLRLALRLLEDWNEEKFDYEMVVRLPKVTLKRNNGKTEECEPFYLVEKGKVTFGGLFETANTKLDSFAYNKKTHKKIIKFLIDIENKISIEKIISYKILD